MLVGSAATARLAAGRTRFLGSHEGAFLPMVPEVYQALRARHETQDCPTEGWVFPTASASGHMEEPSAMQWHAKALATLVKAHKEDPGANPEVRPFELRDTHGPTCDVFTLARIVGHSSITISQRYCHPQADAVERAFAQMAGTRELVTDGGHRQERPKENSQEEEDITLSISER